MTGYVVYSSPLGAIKIGYDGDVITFLKKTDDAPNSHTAETALTRIVFNQVMEYLQGKRREFNFPYELHGTDFQKRVWSELCKIPYGETRTYKEIACAVGNPKASRAVGMANNKNPITIAVPCHRVVGSDGRLIGYAGGLDMKAALLKLEHEAIARD